MMTRQLQEEYAEITRHCFSNTASDGVVYGLFGRHDDMVDTYDLFASHYSNAIRFDGGHHADDSVIIHSLTPVIRWIDDRQNGRQREVMYVCLENVIRRNGLLLPSAMKGLERLAAIYDLHSGNGAYQQCRLLPRGGDMGRRASRRGIVEQGGDDQSASLALWRLHDCPCSQRRLHRHRANIRPTAIQNMGRTDRIF